jgi:hypothetical protein
MLDPPDERYTAPLEPVVATPDPSMTPPELPALDEPLDRRRVPDAPVDETPDDSVTLPLFP